VLLSDSLHAIIASMLGLRALVDVVDAPLPLPFALAYPLYYCGSECAVVGVSVLATTNGRPLEKV